MATLPFLLAADLGLLAAAGAGVARVVAAARRQAERDAALRRRVDRERLARNAQLRSSFGDAEAWNKIPIVYRRRVEPRVTSGTEDERPIPIRRRAIQPAIQPAVETAQQAGEIEVEWAVMPSAEHLEAQTTAAEGSLPEPDVLPGDLYADPIDGVPFEAGEVIVLCSCGTGYRPATRDWLLEHAGGACVQCQQVLPATLQRLADAEPQVEFAH
jgi:hypothetical protein